MNIPPKYEDVVAELEAYRKSYVTRLAYDAIQQCLTVAEQRESLLKDLLTNSYIAINTMEPGFYLLEKIDAALKPAEEGEVS